MRILTFDQFEFENPSTEESLELWIARKSQFPFPDVRSFVVSVADDSIANALRAPVIFANIGYAQMVRDYLVKFAFLEIPTPCDWLAYELSSGICEWDAVFEGAELFIRFHWWSVA